MRKMTPEEVKTTQLEILDVTAKFCESHNINYWLDCGTLLGAIRHNGYIPWDDDIDLGMLRPDFDRFIELFNQENNQYKAYCIENNPTFCYPHAKVLDTNTILYEPDENGYKLSVNIDVFVYDNAPDNDRLVKKMYDTRDFLSTLSILPLVKPSGNFFHRAVVKTAQFIMKVFPIGYFTKRMVKNSKKYKEKNTKRVGNFTGSTRMACSKEVFKSFIYHEFEGRSYRIPIGYDEWLKSFYGNYMQLPPIEKRVTHHSYVAYKND